jgi:hypothetical protein
MKPSVRLWYYLDDFFLRMRNVSGRRCTENQTTHFTLNTLFSPENPAVYKTMWKNMADPNRPDTTAHTQNVQYLLLYYGKNGYANAPQVYVIRTLPVLFNLSFR